MGSADRQQDRAIGPMKKHLLDFAVSVVLILAAVLVSDQALSPVRVRIDTTLGNIDIAVDVQHAPVTAANFLRYVDGHYYDGGQFYRAARPDTYHANPPNRPPMELIEARIPASKT